MLTLLYHPLSSFCHKVLIGLYELEVPFAKRMVNLGDEAERTAFQVLWPIGKFPVVQDEASGLVIPESTIILDYLDQRFGTTARRLVPTAPDAARECRLWDRLFDAYIHLPMQKIVGDRLRPEGSKDAFGVEQARAQLATAYAHADAHLARGGWVAGDAFSLADCAAAPALFFANKVAPFSEGRSAPNLRAYFERLKGRPSYARVLDEMAPYAAMFPG